MSRDIPRRPTSPADRCSSTSCENCVRNQRSIFVSSWTSSTVHPRSNARKTAHIRRSVGTLSSRCSAPSSSSAVSPDWLRRVFWPKSSPLEPSSSELNAFMNASLKVRPIAITSPTDFICVVSVRSARGNFSNVQRGTLTTT